MTRIDKTRYLSREFAAAEEERLWPRVWLMACHSSQIPDPGSFQRLGLGRESVLVIRQMDGSVRAMHNVCRHRGNPICSADAGRGDALRCPYHGWTYDLDGRILSITDADTLPDAADRALDLKPVACTEGAGFVWIRLSADGPSLDEFLGEAAPILEAYRLADWALTRALEIELPANWKTGCDAHAENYHVHSLHPETLPLIDDTAVGIDMLGPHGRLRVPFGRSSPRLDHGDGPPPELAGFLLRIGLDAAALPADPDAARRAIQRGLRAQTDAAGIDTSALSDDQISDTHLLYVFPNLHLNLRATDLLMFRHRPHPRDPERCFFDQWSFKRLAPEAARPGPAPMERGVYPDISAGPVTDVDLHQVARVQQGMRSSGFDGLNLTTQEALIAHMHDGISKYLGGG